MWKFVSRRIRDSVERTYNVLEHRRTWTCGGEKGTPTSNNSSTTCADELGEPRSTAAVPAEKPVLCLVQFYKGHDWHKGSSSSNDDFRRQNSEFESKQNILGALKWSGAIVCGWYASQILCNRRRHLHQDAWTVKARCRHSRTLVSPSREFHKSVLSHWEKGTPTADKKRCSVPGWLRKSLDVVDGPRKPLQPTAEVYPVNNDRLYLTSPTPAKKTLEQKSEVIPPSPTVETAVHDLLKVVGDIEFQLGVQHLQNEHFDTAVAHFKLGTSHNHSGATYNLGLCYELGLGVAQNAKMALQCYTIAAEMGHPKALYNLAIYHGQGLAGLTKSRRTGRQYLKAAARLGQEDALRALGWRLDSAKTEATTAGSSAPPSKHEFSPVGDFLLAVSVA